MIRVTRREDVWTAFRSGREQGRAVVAERPDGRRWLLLRQVSPDAVPVLIAVVAAEVDGRLHLASDEDDQRRRRAAHDVGFTVHRREHRYVVPTTPDRVAARVRPHGVEHVSLADADLERAAQLDTVLRQDVPGCDGWRTTPEDLADEMTCEPFDPATYLLAVERGSGRYLGLARVWWNTSGPRLGLIGVVADRRRGGLATALLGEVLGVVADRGHTGVTTEADVTNDASNALLRRLGSRRVGGELELVRPEGRARSRRP